MARSKSARAIPVNQVDDEQESDQDPVNDPASDPPVAPDFEPEAGLQVRDEDDSEESDDEDDMHDPRRAGFRARVENMRPLTRRSAAARLHVTPGTLKRWEKDGKIHSQKKDGKAWYDPQEVEELAEEHDGEEVGSAQLLSAAARIIAQSREVSQQQMAHIENVMAQNDSLVKTYVGSIAAVLEIQGKVVKEVRERCQQLEDKLWESRAKIDAAETQEVEREIMKLGAVAKQERDEKLLNGAMALLPSVIALVAKKSGVDTQTAIDPMLQSFFSSLTPEQLGRIVAANVLSQEQLVAFGTVYKMVAPEAAAKMAEAAEAARPTAVPPST